MPTSSPESNSQERVTTGARLETAEEVVSPYDEDGVDLELIREALARSPLERLRHLASWQRSVAWLRRARPVTD